MNATSLSPFEHEVIAAFLRADHPVFDALRKQLDQCRVADRAFTGVGFFTRLAVPPDVAPARVTRTRLALSDVGATLDGLQHGAGFILWVENGVLETLEAFSYDETWPQIVDNYRVHPISPVRPGGAESDLEAVTRAFDPSGAE